MIGLLFLNPNLINFPEGRRRRRGRGANKIDIWKSSEITIMMFPSQFVPTKLKNNYQRVLIIDNLERAPPRADDEDVDEDIDEDGEAIVPLASSLVPKMVEDLINEKFEVVLLADDENEIKEICEKVSASQKFSYYLSKWIKLEYVVRIHHIESIIRLTNFTRDEEDRDLFKSLQKYGVKRFVVSVFHLEGPRPSLMSVLNDIDVESIGSLDSFDATWPTLRVIQNGDLYGSESEDRSDCCSSSSETSETWAGFDKDEEFHVLRYTGRNYIHSIIEDHLKKLEI